MNNRRIFASAVLIALLSAATTFSHDEPVQGAFLLNKEVISIASEPDYPPYCIVDRDGNADGFSVELFKAAADAVGLKVTIKIGIWSHIKEDLAQGRIDALPLVGRTPEREDIYDFTMPYLSLHGAVFVRKGDSGIRSIEDLKGREVLVMEGDNAEEFVRRGNISDRIFTTKTFEEAFRILSRGDHDAVITQRVLGIEILKQAGIKNVAPLGFRIPGFRQDFCFAVRKGNAPLLSLLNEGLSVIIANDTFERIRLKWFGPSEKSGPEMETIIRTAAFILIPVIVIMSFFWIVFLRREVRRRTLGLNRKIHEHEGTLSELNRKQVLLKEREEEIRLLLDSTAEGIYRIDLKGNCTLINDSAMRMLGFSDKGDVIGKNMHEMIHRTRADGSAFPAEECRIFQSFRAGRKIRVDDEVFFRTDGTGFPVEYFSYPIRKDGVIQGAVVTFMDITERKEYDARIRMMKEELEAQVAEKTGELRDKVAKLDKSQKALLFMIEDLNHIAEELKEERKKLEFSNRELEAFSYSVSHDLRAPLRAINGFSAFLLEDYAGKLDDNGKRYIDTIRQNAVKMDTLISDLLNLSRISIEKLKLYRVDMKATAGFVFNETASDEEKKTFDVRIGDMPPVTADPNLIKQVLENLIRNALKYSEKSETKQIIISASEEKDRVVFSVKDHGAGFNPKYKHKLFGVFQRLHREDEFEGTGVGLAIVKRIISFHGGEVWAEGEPDQGAEFFFSLPKIKEKTKGEMKNE